MPLQNLEHYVAKAEDALDNISKANTDMCGAMNEYTEAVSKLIAHKHLIESKKNNLIASGSIVGKNADERSASLWIAIPEYDSLVDLEISASILKNKIDMAKSNLEYWKSTLELNLTIIKELQS